MKLVIIPHKSEKYSVEETLEKSAIEYDNLLYIFDKWISLSFVDMRRLARKKLRNEVDWEKVDEVYLVGAGYIPAVLSVWEVMKEFADGKRLWLLDYDTKLKVYRCREVF